MRYLTHEAAGIVATERSRVGSEGRGRALLDRQASEGWWVRPSDEGWVATTDGLVLLREIGLEPPGVQRLQAARRDLRLPQESQKGDRFDLLISTI